MAERWYRDGLRFECTQCGACCSGAPGFVWVNATEIEALAVGMKMDEGSFREKFVRKVATRTSLIEYPDGDCIFLDPKTRACMVYEQRPIQCRTWPFWGSNLRTKQDWADTCASCPGAGVGQLYSLEQIEVTRRQKKV